MSWWKISECITIAVCLGVNIYSGRFHSAWIHSCPSYKDNNDEGADTYNRTVNITIPK